MNTRISYLYRDASNYKQHNEVVVPICNNCHNMGEVTRRIHGNPMAEKMSKIIG